MAYSKASTVKYVKAIGKYDESELGDALGQFSAKELEKLYELTKKVHSCLQSVCVDEVAGKKDLKKQTKMSQQEKLKRTIKKIELALD